jgi:hypothetical protein
VRPAQPELQVVAADNGERPAPVFCLDKSIHLAVERLTHCNVMHQESYNRHKPSERIRN